MPLDAAAAARKIVANQGWYELGVALGLFSTACYVALAGLFYTLFKPASQILALLAAFVPRVIGYRNDAPEEEMIAARELRRNIRGDA